MATEICYECEFTATFSDHNPSRSKCCNAPLISFEEFSQLQAQRLQRKNELKRKQKNSAQRARYAAMRSVGMVKTPYGWE